MLHLNPLITSRNTYICEELDWLRSWIGSCTCAPLSAHQQPEHVFHAITRFDLPTQLNTIAPFIFQTSVVGMNIILIHHVLPLPSKAPLISSKGTHIRTQHVRTLSLQRVRGSGDIACPTKIFHASSHAAVPRLLYMYCTVLLKLPKANHASWDVVMLSCCSTLSAVNVLHGPSMPYKASYSLAHAACTQLGCINAPKYLHSKTMSWTDRFNTKLVLFFYFYFFPETLGYGALQTMDSRQWGCLKRLETCEVPPVIPTPLVATTTASSSVDHEASIDR